MVAVVLSPAAAAILITSYGASVITLSRQHNPQHPQRYEKALKRRIDGLSRGGTWPWAARRLWSACNSYSSGNRCSIASCSSTACLKRRVPSFCKHGDRITAGGCAPAGGKQTRTVRNAMKKRCCGAYAANYRSPDLVHQHILIGTAIPLCRRFLREGTKNLELSPRGRCPDGEG